jgi:BioD-like phosphotransacetylase family protein
MKRTTALSLVTVTNRNFRSITLFKSGIENLLEILKEEEPTKITISDREYEYL